MKLHESLYQFHNDNVNANPTTTTAIDFQYQEQQQLQEQQQQHSATLVVNPNDDVIKQNTRQYFVFNNGSFESIRNSNNSHSNGSRGKTVCRLFISRRRRIVFPTSSSVHLPG